MIESNDKPLVSIIVTTKNEEKNIVHCLTSIRSQNYPRIEVIVVDNASADNTKALAKDLADLVVDMGPERSRQRNHGICELASGIYAMFVDADMVLTGQLVDECVKMITSSGAVAIHIEEKVLGKRWLAKIRRFERSFYSGTVVDGVRFFPRDSFCRLGGFDEKLPPGPEDWDLDKRYKKIGQTELLSTRCMHESWAMERFINSRGVIHERSFVGIYHNEDEQNITQYLRKKIYYSPSIQKYIEKWGKKDPDIIRQTGFLYRYVVVFIESGRWRRLLAHPLMSIAMLTLRVFVGLVYLAKRKNEKT
jgi:glycosyltransferase involved in cell wall biosynthesis